MVQPQETHRPPLHTAIESYVSVTGATYAAKAGDRLIGVNRAGTVTITLPSAQLRAGRTYTVKDESGAAASNNITVATEGSETIDGSATDVISDNYGAKHYYSNGSDWFEVPLLPAIAVAHSATTGQGTDDHHAEAHTAAHASGGADAIKLDDLSAADDNTDLDFSTSAHGLVPKGTNVGDFLKDDGTWAAPAGGSGAVTREGGSTTEATTTSTSLADIISASSLSIAAGAPIEVLYVSRKSSGAANDANSAFTINSTNLASEKVFSGTDQAEAFVEQWLFGPRVTNYTGVPRHIRLASSASGSYDILAHGATSLPTATVTALNTRGSVDDALITLGHDEYHIYSWAVS
jgi:hypothetical protein